LWASFLRVSPLPIDRTLTVQESAAVDDLPDCHVLDPEASSGFGNPQSAVAGGKTMALDGIKEALALFSIGFFRRQAGSKGSQLIPCIFETRLGRLVPVNEDRITVRIMSQRAKRRLFVEPARRV
jgi:hypothetical protein